MSDASVLWAETPDEDREPAPEQPDAEGQLDESFAARRLRRWIRGMFGGTPKPTDGGKAADREPEAD